MTTPQAKVPSSRPANRLAQATSPYLLQHARNPVDWYEWGDEALRRAEAESKPIFLSIGYSACHWCHVMEHECFENAEAAEVLNRHFVSIKVDREERPDIDELYMHVTLQMNNGHGGWPMSVFLTPQRLPIYAGTYFPREQFMRLCAAVADAWERDRGNIEESASRFRDYLQEWAKGPTPSAEVLSPDAITGTADTLLRYFDPVKGGMGSGNKFPPSMAMELLLRVHANSGAKKYLDPVVTTLDRMANGGIYDHLGGGICRYATDPDWLVPHFEKMLYDQALVSAIFLDAYQVTRKELYAQRAREIFDYVIADLQSPEGGFYSTRDADSEGMEGKYYIWTVEQIRQALGEDDAKLFCAYYDVTESGNWDERFGHAPSGPKNILNVQRDAEVVAKLHGLEISELRRRLADMKTRLLAVRARRVPPGLDDKILSGWNGLMVASLAKGARVLNDGRYAQAAARAADFVLDRMRADGRLLRTYRQGRARLSAYFDDYAFLIEGVLNLYEATQDARCLEQAISLEATAAEYYYDPIGGGFFYTASDAEPLVVRSKNPQDGAIPSGNSVHALNLVRLAAITGQATYRDRATSIFKAFGTQIGESPGAFERLLCALDFYYHGGLEIAVIGRKDSPEAQSLFRVVFSGYLPNKVVVHADSLASEESATRIPLLRGRGMVDGKATAYVCENRVCRRPVTDSAELAKELRLAQPR